MKTTLAIVGVLAFAALCTACGSEGGGKSKQNRPQPPEPPVVTVDAGIKQLIFSWDDVPTTTYYRLLENADGHSGFTQVADDLPAGTPTITKHFGVHLQDWVNALYMVQACNSGGCSASSAVNVTDLMLDAIGYFKASDTQDGDQFGNSLAVSADGSTLAVAGAYRRGGAVYIFRFDGTSWHQQTKLETNHRSGALALSEDGNLLGVGATDVDHDSGEVYIFRFNGTEWSQTAGIQASEPEEHGGFGWALALSGNGDTLLVGAPGDTYNSTFGAAYLFRFDGTEWVQQAHITAQNIRAADSFGAAVALSADGSTLAIGTIHDSSDATGINGDEGSRLAPSSGAVYLFRFDGSEWIRQAYIKASNTDMSDFFGRSVSLAADGNTLAVGADLESSNATGIDGDQDDDSAQWSGAVYVFRFTEMGWIQQAYVKSSNSEALDFFGSSTSLSADGNTLAVVAPAEDSDADGVGGDQNDNSASSAGAAYVFQFDGSGWHQENYIKAPNSDGGENQSYDRFGRSLAINGDANVLTVGTSLERSGATGINGDQDDNSVSLAGAVYVY